MLDIQPHEPVGLPAQECREANWLKNLMMGSTPDDQGSHVVLTPSWSSFHVTEYESGHS